MLNYEIKHVKDSGVSASFISAISATLLSLHFLLMLFLQIPIDSHIKRTGVLVVPFTG